MSTQLSPNTVLSPGETIGPYTIVRRVPGGVGGMATVYEALQAGTNLRVALKIAREGKGSFLRDEAAFMRVFKLHHPHIIQLVPTPIGGGLAEYILKDPHTNAWYFAMEYMAGGSLADWLERRKKLPIDTAVEIACQIALALDGAHSAGLLHLDVKPSNILFRQPPEKAYKIEAVLTDFGVSRPKVRAASGSAMTSLTVEYASPEQALLVQELVTADTTMTDLSSTINIGPASDLYSLATILYEMISGQLPFPMLFHDDLVYLHKIVYDPPALPLSSVPPELNAVLVRALHKDPKERYPSAREFLEDLQLVLRQLAREQTIERPRLASKRAARVTFVLGVTLMLFSVAQLINVLPIPANPFGPDGPSSTAILLIALLAAFVSLGASASFALRQARIDRFASESVRRMTRTFQRRTGIKGLSGAVIRPASLATLILESEPYSGKRIYIEEHAVFLGRVPERADIVFDWDEYLSGRHAKIQYEQGWFFIWDMQSANGTWVNDRRVPRSRSEGVDYSEAIELSDGSVIRLGPDLRLRFNAETALDRLWTQAASQLSPFASSLPTEVRGLIEQFTESITLTVTDESLVGEFFCSEIRVGHLFPQINMPIRLPILVPRTGHIPQPNAVDSLDTTMRSIKSNIAMLFLPYPQPEEDFQTLEGLRRAYARDLIVIDQDAFRSIVEADSPTQVFRRLILSQVSLTSVSPFVLVYRVLAGFRRNTGRTVNYE